jgi:isocitrate dehydrogenase (NAD+)
MMLEHLGMQEEANRIRDALEATIREGDSLTPDLGGTGTTDSFTDAPSSAVCEDRVARERLRLP